MARVTEEHQATGEQKIIYHKIGPDHDRHAHAYGTQAASLMGRFFGYGEVPLFKDGAEEKLEWEEADGTKRVAVAKRGFPEIAGMTMRRGDIYPEPPPNPLVLKELEEKAKAGG